MQVRINGVPVDVTPDATLDLVIATVTVRADGVAAAVDDEVVPRSQWSMTLIHEGARVEVLTAVQGG